MNEPEEPFGTPDAGLAQVMVGSTEQASGMAFMVSAHVAVTCAHVVNVALGREMHDRSPLPPEAVVRVRFPLAEDISHDDGSYDLPERKAKVLKFKPPGRLPADDIALLSLTEAAPPEVGQSVLAEIREVTLDRDELGVFGPPAGSPLAVHFDARFGGKVNPSWAQIDAASASGSFVTGGFSGGRVWSYTHEAAIGMIVAMQMGGSQRRAFIIPAAAIRKFLTGIPSEVRQVGPNFCAVWTVFAICFFALVMSHFLGERIGNYSGPLALGGGNTVVNGFYGMHINALLMPIAFAMLLRFAAGYSEHPYWMRLPSFGRFRRPPRPTASRLATFLTLALFVVVPLYVQAHFLRGFHSRGHVYIYPGSFGFASKDLEDRGYVCHKSRVDYCRHPDLSIYSIVAPNYGSEAGYLNNAYQYGDRSLATPASVTFFPILQPLAIWALSLASLVMATSLLMTLFRTASRKQPTIANEDVSSADHHTDRSRMSR
jgi:hypothetical protein